MKTIIFYDTETTGLPDWKAPSDSETQPHLVQLAAILCNEETREIIDTLDVVIKPNGWVITPENAAIHGTTQEMAEATGIDEAEAFKHFTGEELQGAHTAMGDAKGCMAVYWAMCDLEKVPS